MATTVSVGPVDVVDLVATVVTVATVRVDTGDVMPERVKKAAHLASSLLRSVAGLVVAVVRLLLPRGTAATAVDDCSGCMRATWEGGLDGSVFSRVREIAGGAEVEGGR